MSRKGFLPDAWCGKPDLSDSEVTAFIGRARNAGFAVTVFTPEEVGSLDPSDIEDAMVRAGHEAIEFLDPGRVAD